MAQTMHLASFEPVYVVTTFHLPHVVYYNLNKLINSYKTQKKKKTLTNGPNGHVSRRLGLFSSFPPSTSCFCNYKQHKR